MTTKSRELEFAIETVRLASQLVVRVQSEMVNEALTKEDKSPVTIADFSAQALVSARLLEEYPDDPLIGEEDSKHFTTPAGAEALEQVINFVKIFKTSATKESILSWIDHGNSTSGEKYWTVDPIDGTKGFLRGQQYAVALALVIKGEVEIGVLGCPNLRDGYNQDIGGPGSIIYAQKGMGTWVIPITTHQPPTQFHTSDISNGNEARFLRSYEAGHTNVNQLDLIANAMEVTVDPVRLDSQAKYAILAAGHGDAIFRLISPKMPYYKEKVWDQAAGSLVAEEAGGMVTDLNGNKLRFDQGITLKLNRGVLATNKKLHSAALAAIHEIGA